MPLIHCPKCGQAYDVPPAVAVRLPNSVASCFCGEWLAGSKAALLARLAANSAGEVNQVDLSPYRIDAPTPGPAAPATAASDAEPFDLSSPRSIRVIARGPEQSINTVFTVHKHPLWIGRKGCHVELDDAELSIRHCSISLRGDQLVVRDGDSYTGTFLDGQPISEAVLPEGVHVLRVGSALVSIETTADAGNPVEPVSLEEDDLEGLSALLTKRLQGRKQSDETVFEDARRTFLVCIDGALAGQEFEIPDAGLIVGREGHVRVPDEFLSRKHFEVHRDEEGIIRVRDMGSRNGTFLNTLPAKNTKVHAGDEIRAGVNRFRIEER
jgi:pSer/pThr/pTyr-binding forkhead associated (FHA) protein